MSQWSANVEPSWDFTAWRTAARTALCAGIEPENIQWQADLQASLISAPNISTAPALNPAPSVPREFFSLAQTVLCHRSEQRHALLYRMLWRIVHGERHLLMHPADPDTCRMMEWSQAVRRDAHKMKAFVRFREAIGKPNHFAAWFEPEHFIVDRIAPYFMRRFTGMQWAILTPYRSAFWDGNALLFGAGAHRSDAPTEDASEALWRTYYAHIFNPARLNPRMMRQEMPQKYWKNLPEATLVPTLIRDAGHRVTEMTEREYSPPRRRIPSLQNSNPTDEVSG